MLENPLYIDMILDILSERGFSVNVDSKTIERPVRVDFSTLQVIHEMYAHPGACCVIAVPPERGC